MEVRWLSPSDRGRLRPVRGLFRLFFASRAVAVLATAAALTASAAACTITTPDDSLLQKEDLAVAGDIPYDPGVLIDDERFQETAPYRERTLQQFFEKLPYREGARIKRSFLASYFSNGRSAALSIAEIGAKYNISPLVLLARIQMYNGLVSQENYPVDAPWLVEFVFGCGCTAPGVCAATSQGLDRQIECLASNLRKEIDKADKGPTSSGWAIGQPRTTFDGLSVTPQNKTAAATYTIDPFAGVSGDRGAKLFTNIFELYYTQEAFRAARNGTLPKAFPGETCRASTDCDPTRIEKPLCMNLGDNKVCGALCDAKTSCESIAPGLQCVVLSPADKSGICLEGCDPTSDCGRTRACQAEYTFVADGKTEKRMPVCYPISG